MRLVPFSEANDWERHPELQQAVPWQTASGEECIEFEARVGDAYWAIRLNDFPDEPAYTVLIDCDEVIHFDNWPKMWIRPEYPKRQPIDPAPNKEPPRDPKYFY